MGLYWWVRTADETGMSGQGRVAQVAVFEDGSAVLRWIAARNTAGTASTVIYERVEDLVHVHGHGDRKTGHLEPVDAASSEEGPVDPVRQALQEGAGDRAVVGKGSPLPAHGGLTQEERDLLNKGKTLEAIRLIRERTGMGLCAAKMFLDKQRY